jgi:hypothetical protein
MLKFDFGGGINKNSPPQKHFFNQNNPLHSILTAHPIHIQSNLIDAARQAQYDTKLKNFKISI